MFANLQFMLFSIWEDYRAVRAIGKCESILGRKFIGAVKHRLHARRLAVEALTENAKLLEAYKMYYKEQLRVSEETEGNCVSQRGTLMSGICLLAPVEHETLHAPIHLRSKTRGLLEEYLSRTEGLSITDSKRVLSDASIWSHGRAQMIGASGTVIGAMRGKRHRKA